MFKHFIVLLTFSESLATKCLFLNDEPCNRTSQRECKNYRQCKEDYSWNPSICIFENSKYLKSITDNSVTERDEIVIVMGII